MIGLVGERGAPPVHSGLLADLARRHRVPGAQLAIHEDGRTETVETGEVEFGTRRRVTPGSAFAIGSITKAFTATLAMVLVADGDLDLDAPIADHLPDCDLDDALTLRHVLSHTGGLASGEDPDPAATARRHLVEHCRRPNRLVPPGTAFSYSNLGYVIAGCLIETVTGMSWWEATEAILLRPLGIDPVFGPRTGDAKAGSARLTPRHDPARARPMVTGHSVSAAVGRTRPVRPVSAPAEAAAGGLAVSAADLVSLGLLHLGAGMPDLLPAAHAAQMRAPVEGAEPFGLADGWGLGLARFRRGGTDWYGHDGNVDGTSCYLRIDPEGGRIVALTSNANTGAALWADLQVELDRAGIPLGPIDPAPSAPSAVAPDRGCLGTYINGDVEFTVVARDGGRLHLGVDGEFGAMTFHAGLTFSLRDPRSGRLVPGGRFLRDPATGRVDSIQVNGRLGRRRTRFDREIRQRTLIA